MRKDELALVLTKAAAFDYRNISEADVEAWMLVIGDLTFAECDAAVVEYYKENRERIMPSDIRQRVMGARQQWLADHPTVGPLHPEIVAPWLGGRELEPGS